MGCRVALVWAIVLGGCRLHFDAVGLDALGDAAGDSPLTDSDAPAVVDCPAFALFCEDFELGNLSRWSDMVLDGPATVVVSTTRARSGAYALEATVGPAAEDSGEASVFRTLPPQSTGALALRQWINLDAPLRAFNIIVAMRSQATGEYVTAGGNNDTNWVSTENDATVSVDHHSATATPGLDVWTCVELVYAFTPPGAPRVELYVNDAQVLDVASVHVAPSFDEVRIGIVRADSAGFSLFIDDVVVADQRIGCE